MMVMRAMTSIVPVDAFHPPLLMLMTRVLIVMLLIVLLMSERCLRRLLMVHRSWR